VTSQYAGLNASLGYSLYGAMRTLRRRRPYTSEKHDAHATMT
jgi:hypothetical protein